MSHREAPVSASKCWDCGCAPSFPALSQMLWSTVSYCTTMLPWVSSFTWFTFPLPSRLWALPDKNNFGEIGLGCFFTFSLVVCLISCAFKNSSSLSRIIWYPKSCKTKYYRYLWTYKINRHNTTNRNPIWLLPIIFFYVCGYDICKYLCVDIKCAHACMWGELLCVTVHVWRSQDNLRH